MARTTSSLLTFVMKLVGMIIYGAPFLSAAIDAVITDEKGTTTSIKEVTVVRHSQVRGGTYYIDIPTVTDVSFSSIYLQSGDVEQYQIEVPLRIIRSITRIKTSEQRQANVKNEKPSPSRGSRPSRSSIIDRQSALFNVLLSDGTALKGRIRYHYSFSGTASSGAFKVPAIVVNQISFSAPQGDYQAKANGQHQVTLHLSESGKLSLTGTTFIIENRNKNGCFIKYSYNDADDFSTESHAIYQFSWDKISELRFIKEINYPHDISSVPADVRELMRLSSKTMQVISSSGEELKGRFSAFGIEGVSKFGAFDLHVVVPFSANANKIVFQQVKLPSADLSTDSSGVRAVVPPSEVLKAGNPLCPVGVKILERKIAGIGEKNFIALKVEIRSDKSCNIIMTDKNVTVNTGASVTSYYYFTYFDGAKKIAAKEAGGMEFGVLDGKQAHRIKSGSLELSLDAGKPAVGWLAFPAEQINKGASLHFGDVPPVNIPD